MDKLEQYFIDTMDKIGELNEVDEFAKLMLNIIKSGNVELYLKRFNETKIFDDAWINTFEGYFINIDNIIRNPRKQLKDEEDLVPVERARNLSVKTVQHLARNTQYIKDIDENGIVVPSKVLSIRREEDLGIYENRFIKTLINRIYSFIKRRYDVIKENYESFTRDHLQVISNYNTDVNQVSFRLDIDIRHQQEDSKLNENNYQLLQRVERLYSMVKGFKTSSFMQAMDSYKEILPPIMKTNIILKNVDFKAALAFWLFLDHYNALGLETALDEHNLSLESNFQSDIYSLIILSYVTALVNDRKREEKYADIDYASRLIRRPHLRHVTEELEGANQDVINAPGDEGSYWEEQNPLTDYILNETKINYAEEYKKLLESGKTEAEASDIILNKLLSVTNELYQNFFKVEQDPEEIFKGLLRPKDIDVDEQLSMLKDRNDILKAAIKIKEDDLAKAKAEQDLYQKQLDKFEKTRAERVERDRINKEKAEERRKKANEIARMKAEIIKQVEEQKEKERQRIERIPKKAAEQEARRLREKMEKEKLKEKEKLQMQKLKQDHKEKEKLKSLKEKEKAKARIQALKEKEKEREKLRALKEKERLKERAKQLKLQLRQSGDSDDEAESEDEA